MNVRRLHGWEVNFQEAYEIQRNLAQKISLEYPGFIINTVAGADISYSKRSTEVYAGVVLLKVPQFEILEQVSYCTVVSFPYIPGLLSFREAPVLVETFQKLTNIPDMAIFDGHGIAHPRGCGLASHMGLILDIPTIGCAKEMLVGRFDSVGEEIGNFSLIEFSNQQVGAALRTKKNVKPIFVSPGHKMSLQKSIEIVLKTGKGYRLPEPIRLAHIFVNQIRSSHMH
ncbi:MAG: deoxyribonuclease V [bacterium]